MKFPAEKVWNYFIYSYDPGSVNYEIPIIEEIL